MRSSTLLEVFVTTQLERGRRVLSKNEVCYALQDLRSVRLAAEALADLASAPGSAQPAEPLRCKPGPGPVPRPATRTSAQAVAMPGSVCIAPSSFCLFGEAS